NLLKESMRGPNTVEEYVPHIISIWNYACKYDQLVRDFIVDAISESNYTTYFHLIVENSRSEVVKDVFSKISSDRLQQIINLERKDKKTLLHCAALGGNEKTVRLLVEKGADVDAHDHL